MKNPWPAGITIVIVLFALGMALMVRIAVRNPEDLVREDHYERAVHYQQELDRESAASPIAADSLARFIPGTGLLITLPAGAVAGRVQLYRPSDAKRDRTLDYTPAPDGHQVIPAAALQPGRWRVRLMWMRDGVAAQKEVTFYASP